MLYRPRERERKWIPYFLIPHTKVIKLPVAWFKKFPPAASIMGSMRLLLGKKSMECAVHLITFLQWQHVLLYPMVTCNKKYDLPCPQYISIVWKGQWKPFAISVLRRVDRKRRRNAVTGCNGHPSTHKQWATFQIEGLTRKWSFKYEISIETCS